MATTEREQTGKNRIKTLILCFVLFMLLIAADLVTKQIAYDRLSGGRPFVLIDGVLEFRYTANTGAAFGMLKGARVLFSVIAAAAIGVIFWLIAKTPADRKYYLFKSLLLLIAAGAAGNLIDRLFLGYVRDFIYFSLINFPIFNVADIYVTCATFLMVIAVLFYYREDHDFDFIKK